MKNCKKLIGAIVGGAVAVSLLTGFNADKVQMTTTHTVKAGDTLRDISFKYLPLNTYSRRYVLDFEYDIRQANAELQDSVDIYPGQEIIIPYYVKGE